MIDLYQAIWRVTGRRQPLLVFLSVLVAALAAAPLKLQQLIVNGLVHGGDRQRLVWLCLGLLAVVLLSAALKFAVNLSISVVGERVVLLIRERLYRNAVGAAAAGHAPRRGALVAKLSAEAEAVGSFAGAALASPIMQLGTLVSVIAFILASQPWLGLLALAVVLPQAAIVIAIQSRINRRVRERVQALRDVSDRISDGDPAALDPRVVADFHDVYAVRRRIFGLKLSAKLALSAISAVGVAGILLLGGLLVLAGRSDVGTVVASLSGLGRIEKPWRELVGFFRSLSTVRVQYEMLAGFLGRRDGRA
jgi:ABC-type bacteriocin/lantibiotic exporter with double-glycine peptidase domain